ncbi:PI-PLC X domain-containing protein 1 isoform X1 [Mustela erminea]|uniref:PI-PLC X domain-containing protein 1 isoform X1 n=1 Tax=Mustela erminea TaxID=36723 RepID=UPI0013870AB5|nr:PI-PLC X domain-containing protein 1 isoform X1 [Mustela erminea]XP_032185945.1 PI-PLC X domain-containing protein 1 isoform X1 [Mustela erminea]XP_032185946.1 PI-PLC X domain-containing protein 1 isoform X1 [Mustela erminea]XP_032185947.1 PI-PLC X domain-containing protein 1 isoform X1 [Mustela erminea]XP_032185948.1 PI-PLC X domain-containing protein 1 isoform X1 [Mustela erminea]XP_032185949.1 PI-PLC X domain-containing protein 1 isoform X1 [Mustela erminea]XP_032185950.1 PI-PLC X domai
MGGQVSTSGSFRSLPCTTNADWMSALCPVLWDVPLHQLSIPGAGCHGAAGRGRAVPGPADRTHAGRLGEEPALCAHGVHDGAGGGHAHGDLRVAGEPPPGGGHPGLQGLRGHDGRPARVPGRLHQEHLWGHAVSARGEEGPWGRGWAGLEGWAYPLVLLCMVRGEVCCVLRLRSSGCPERRRPGLSGAECSLPEAPALPAHRRATSFAPQEVPTLNQMWSRGQQVILSYEEDSVVNRHAELWPGIPYWWGDQVKPQELIRYLERMKSCGRPGEHVLCTHGTPACRRAVRGGHQPDGEPGVRPGAPDRVPQEDDAPQPAVPPCVGPGAEPGAGRSVHQHHRRRLHRGGRVRGRRHKTQREAASMLTPSAAPADSGRAAWTRGGLPASP